MTEFCLLSRRNETEPFTKSLSLRPVDPASFEGEVAALLSIPITALWIPEWRGDAVDDVLVSPDRRCSMARGSKRPTRTRCSWSSVASEAASCAGTPTISGNCRVLNAPMKFLDLVKTAIATEACELYLDAILDRSIT
jgi:hypothetical protein